MRIRNLFVRIPKNPDSQSVAYIQAAVQLFFISLLILFFLIDIRYVMTITLVFLVYAMICFLLSVSDDAKN